MTTTMTLDEYRAWLDTQKPGSKYGNTRVAVDGIAFDSKAEAARYGELQLLARAGQISDLAVHPRYVLVDASAHGPSLCYIADFSYTEQGRQVAEDVKGGTATQTPLWKLKARLFRERYPAIELRVVER